MPNFESGVASYITAKATVKVYFPVDNRGISDICCMQCQFFSRNNGVCQLNKKIPSYPAKFVGAECPLNMEEEETK